MQRLVVLLHVLAAILLIGPLLLAGPWGQVSIRRGDAQSARMAFRMARWTIAGSVLVAVLGCLAVVTSTTYSFSTPWVIISMTLYVVLLGMSAGYVAPALRRAAVLLHRRSAVAALGVPGEPPVEDPGEDVDRARLRTLSDRLAGAAVLSLALVAAMVVLMVYRPFGP